jgi:hypothetical protein
MRFRGNIGPGVRRVQSAAAPGCRGCGYTLPARVSKEMTMRRGPFPARIFLGTVALLGLATALHAGDAVPDSPEAVHPLLIGAEAPAVTVLDTSGEPVELRELLRNKRTVLIFYRGGW